MHQKSNSNSGHSISSKPLYGSNWDADFNEDGKAIPGGRYGCA